MYEGIVYKSIGRPVSSQKHGYTLTMNWDGVSKFKSSKLQAWPIYFQVNELPPDIRFSSSNVILAGIWFGKSKPDSNIVLSIAVKELVDLERGVVGSDPMGNIINVRCRLLLSTMDIPARAAAFLMTYHNGACGCIYCLNKGKHYGNRYAYPIAPRSNNTLRTHTMIADIYSKLKSNPNQKIDGIKGISIFSILPYWSLVRFSAIDLMHLLEGLFKSFNKLWTKAKYSKNGLPRVSRHQWGEYDRLLTQQRIVGLLGRPVRSIIENGKFYKASEILVWFLYMYPCLEGVIPDDEYRHFRSFCCFLFELLKDDLTWHRLEEIEKDLYQWLIDFQRIYGLEYVTLNVHNIGHLCVCINRFGPLWAYTCFPFECYNKIISRSVKGTYRFEKGVANSVGTFQYLKKELDLLSVNIYTEYMIKKSVRKDGVVISNDITVYKKHTSSSNDRIFYNHIVVRGQLFDSHKLVKKRYYNNSVARLKDGSIVTIDCVENNRYRGWRLHCRVLSDGRFNNCIFVSLESLRNWVIVVERDGFIVHCGDVLGCLKLLL